jgi:hypothetical protein
MCEQIGPQKQQVPYISQIKHFRSENIVSTKEERL